MSASLRGFAAPWLVTGTPGELPLRDGAVVFDGEGRVVSVGTEQALRATFPGLSFAREPGLLMPGLVNAHVHLELSALRGQAQSGGGFGPWLTSMMQKRSVLAPEQDEEAIDAAISELLRSGTVAIGEVTNTLASVALLRAVPILGRVFHEIFGMTREAAAHMRSTAQRARDALADWPTHLSYTLAPHTLYSLHPEVAQSLVREARTVKQRTSLHLSEHAAERAFLKDGTGPFAEFLAARNVSSYDFAPPGMSPVEYAEKLGVLGPDVLAVHLCATTADELVRVANAHAQAVLCPRSNLYIELKLPPLYDMLAAGLRPALGTDSLASNTTLDVLAEAATLRDRFPQADVGLLISMATWYGAVALDLSHRVGALREGLTPGLLSFDLAVPTDEPLKQILRSPPPARRVLMRPSLPGPSQTLGDKP